MSMALSVELFNSIVSSLTYDGTCSHGHDKRTQARVGLRAALEVIVCSFTAVKEKPFTIHIHDLSMNGIGLVSPFRLDEGSEFIARFSRDNRPAVPVLYRVKYCRRISNELHAVGALFERVLPDSTGEVLAIGKRKAPRKIKKTDTDAAGPFAVLSVQLATSFCIAK